MEKFINEDDSTIYVITSELDDKHYGMVATWICPASLRTDELRFTLALSKFNHSKKPILTTRKFIIHKLPLNQFMTAYRMGLHHSEEVDKFIDESYSTHESGVRVLKNASSYGLGSVLSFLETEDRYILYCSAGNILFNQKSIQELTQKDLFSQLTESDRLLLGKKYLNDCERDTPK